MHDIKGIFFKKKKNLWNLSCTSCHSNCQNLWNALCLNYILSHRWGFSIVTLKYWKWVSRGTKLIQYLCITLYCSRCLSFHFILNVTPTLLNMRHKPRRGACSWTSSLTLIYIIPLIQQTHIRRQFTIFFLSNVPLIQRNISFKSFYFIIIPWYYNLGCFQLYSDYYIIIISIIIQII